MTVMAERAYTVAEIDRMRELVKLRLSPRIVVNGRTMIRGDVWGSDGTTTPAVAPDIVEDQLRTYMLAGVAPEDLESV